MTRYTSSRAVRTEDGLCLQIIQSTLPSSSLFKEGRSQLADT
jgi:hypothetical protein